MKTTTCPWRIAMVVFLLLGVFSVHGQSKDLAVGVTAEFPPFAFVDDHGQPTGFNVELILALGEVLGWNVDITVGTWSEIMDKLTTGEVDVLASMFYTPERAEQFALSTRHSVATGDVFTRSGMRVTHVEDLRGQKVAVQEGNVVHEYLAGQGLDIEFVLTDTPIQALALLSASAVDYAAMLLIPGHYILEEYQLKDVQSNNVRLGSYDYSFAVAKENRFLQVMIDEGLWLVKHSGKYDEIYQKWLGVYEEQAGNNWKYITRWLSVLVVVSVLVLVWALILRYMVRLRTAALFQSREELAETNEELRATIEELTAATDELAANYGQLQGMKALLSKEKDLLRTTLLSVGEGIVVTNPLGQVTMINPVAEDLIGVEYGSQLHPGILSNVIMDVLESKEQAEIAEQCLVTAGGREAIVAGTVAPMLDENGSVLGAVAAFRDVSESVRQRKAIEYLSLHDPLTDLLNRRGLDGELENIDNTSKLPIAVIVADVNRLKHMNDVFGHISGDELLVQVARILLKVAPKPNIVARLGGDEFMMVLPRSNLTDAEKVVKKCRALAGQHKIKSMQVSIAIGVAVKEREEEDLQDVFERAEQAMYVDKRSGRPDDCGERGL